MSKVSTSILCSGLTLLPLSAFAVAPGGEDQHNALELASSENARVQRAIEWRAPRARHAAWQRFVQMEGGAWRASWDAHTKVPQRIYGRGLPAPGAMTSPKTAEAMAREMLERHLDLLAPGAQLSDFTLVANDYDEIGGLRTVAFEQHFDSHPVIGGQVNFRFKNDRMFVVGSEALPNVDVPSAGALANTGTLISNAERWIRQDRAAQVQARGAADAAVLPVITQSGAIAYHLVREVTVEAREPIGRWSVYLDAHTAKPVARRQTLMFADGDARYNAPIRRPGSTRLDFAAALSRLQVNGQNVDTDDQGRFSWPGEAAAEVVTSVVSGEVRVTTDRGTSASDTFTVEPGGSFTWDVREDELLDAQVNTFVHGLVVKERARLIAPNLRFLSTQLIANVNLNSNCNAFSDGTTINFFVSSRQCENTGRLADVVYHEFGHSFHANAVIRGVGRFETALSEGASDYISATITNDPGMGRGFFYTNAPLRHMDLQDEARWPEDVGEAHTTGVIFAGTMWDLRKALINQMGEAQGVAHTDMLWYQALRRSSDIPSSYVEVLAADDDDGDLNNGTPNACAINEAFARHGLADPTTVGPAIAAPQYENFRVSLPTLQREACPGAQISDARVFWGVRGAPALSGEVQMSESPQAFTAQLPQQTNGQVLEYRVEVQLQSGDVIRYPRNPASPSYEVYLGETTEIYCTDFESEASVEGWTNRLIAGEDREGANDWQWGAPAGTPGSGDPTAAFSGSRVYGNDLGGGNFNGLYQAGKINALSSPQIAVEGFEQVRLQYRRWLNVEDGFYDRAVILANGQEVWTNLNTGDGGTTHHEDQEWRFHDVDVTELAASGQLQVSFQIESDGGLEFGGWTLDDVCLVGIAKAPECGNGQVEEGEACDDGNLVDGDGCEASCSPTPQMPMMPQMPTMPMMPQGPEMPALPTPLTPDEGGCGCTSAEAARSAPSGAWLFLGLIGLLALRRRR